MFMELKDRVTRWAYSTRTQHKSRGCTINFSVNDLVELAISNPTCYYCNDLLSWYNNTTKDNSPTLERLNNDKYLFMDNIAIACHLCNRTKGIRDFNEFTNYCTSIKEKFNGKDLFQMLEEAGHKPVLKR